VLAGRVTIGAPPDEFSPGGQDWGVPPTNPWSLRLAGYEPFIDVARAAFAHTAGIRIDHAAGLFRQFWVPPGESPAHGVYVRFPWTDLCNILALESHRAGAFVVGEDLGTVEPWLREELGAHGVLSWRVAWFETDPPERWPERALATVSTHDLPTVAGVWAGGDAAARRALGLRVDDAAEARLLARLRALADVSPSGSLEAVIGAAHEAVASSPCLLAGASLEDALGVAERPNLPGTTAEWPNWCQALPVPWEAVELDPRPGALAAVFNDAGRSRRS
jgi:4-alpha-glucanotransferase